VPEGQARGTVRLRGNGELVLLVDDDPSVLAICKAALEQSGYRAVASKDGRSALALFAKRHADVSIVVTDLGMPGIDGGQVLTGVRKTKPSVKVVVCSGFLDEAERERLTNLGADAFLAKPYRSADLLRTLREAPGPVPAK
jgi:CheY-like chemotaxis protein